MDDETLKGFIQENEVFIKECYQKYGYIKLKIPQSINQPMNNQPKNLANFYFPEQNEKPQPSTNFENRSVIPPLIQRMGAQIGNFNRNTPNSPLFPAKNPNFPAPIISGGSPAPLSPPIQMNQMAHRNATIDFNRQSKQ
jgi:hypothetical protein